MFASVIERAENLKARYVASAEGEQRYGKPIGEEITSERSDTGNHHRRNRRDPQTVREYVQMFNKVDTDLWGGGDVSISHELPDGRRIWVYGDTLSAKNGLVRNSALVQKDGVLTPSRKGKQLLPDGGTDPADPSRKVIYWPDSIKQGPTKDTVIITSMEMSVGPPGDPWDFRVLKEGQSRAAIMKVDAKGNLIFKRWKGYVPTPVENNPHLAADLIDHGNGHVSYGTVVHDIRLKDGSYLTTRSHNHTDAFENHVGPRGFEWWDYRPTFGSTRTKADDVVVEEKDIVRTPEGAAHYGLPIGSVIVRDAIGVGVPHLSAMPDDVGAYSSSMRRRAKKVTTVAQPNPANPKQSVNPPAVKGAKHLWEMPESDYEGYELWVDALNLKIYVAQDEDGYWGAWDSNSEFIAEGKTRAALIKELDPVVGPELKPGMHWATEAEKKKLVIPPNYRDVMVADDPNAYNYAVGFDYKAKAQWKYTTEFRGERDAIKFERMKKLQKKMPVLDAYLQKNVGDNASDALMMMRVLGMRPDSGEGTGDVETFGATSLLAKHVKVTAAGQVTLNFIPGKKKVPVTIKVKDKALADMLRERLSTRSHNAPLFDDVSSDTTNTLMKKIVGNGFSNKDLRTLKANAIALQMIKERRGKKPKSKSEFNKWRREVGTAVSDVLGNTPTVALGSYINPIVFQDWAVDSSWL